MPKVSLSYRPGDELPFPWHPRLLCDLLEKIESNIRSYQIGWNAPPLPKLAAWIGYPVSLADTSQAVLTYIGRQHSLSVLWVIRQ